MPFTVPKLLAVAASLLGGLTGCSGADVVNALTPQGGYRLVADLPYGDGPRRSLDVYLPDAAPATLPTVVFLYGGGWTSGDKADYRFVGQAFAARGYAVVIPDYRLYPDAAYPAFVEDSAAAVAWAAEKMSRATGVSPRPLFLAGHSAGAYNAAMVTLDERWLKAHGLTPCGTVAAVAGLAGPYDFLPLRGETLKKIFGDPAPAETQPIDHVDARQPPMLLISGTNDTTVRPRNSRDLAARLRMAGGTIEEKYYEKIGHIWLAGTLAAPLQHMAPTLNDVDTFFKREAKTGCG